METTVDHIYKSVAQEMINNIPDDWSLSHLDVEREAGDTIGFSGGWTSKQGQFNSFKFREFKNRRMLVKNFHKLHEITTEGGANKWNKAKFVLKPQGEFEINFEWDQSLADEIEALSKD
ncbi:immunity protein YezG family protein [Agarilytica rhodophyticola]|uniref:immunity protein YezG family protein n=1 Tax=Agarilytica rhodophyticola TaxID=1737490 RepID=UPI000B34327C|nr:immunity protein YezG family protein [Agarilytica rhodophyticola]